jgi:hypothetical protein
MFLWETWVCPILGVPIPVLTANPQQYSYDNLISTLMVIIYKLVSINLQSYLHTNGSFTGTTFLLSTSGKVIQSLSYVIYGQYQDFTDFTFLSSFNILESQRYRLVKSRTHRYPTHCVSKPLPTWLDNIQQHNLPEDEVVMDTYCSFYISLCQSVPALVVYPPFDAPHMLASRVTRHHRTQFTVSFHVTTKSS